MTGFILAGMERTELPDGGLRFSAGRCRFDLLPLSASALLVAIEGPDRGQMGDAVLDELRARIRRPRHLELFVDASRATAAAVEVSEAWTRFLREEAAGLKRVSILAVTNFVHLTVSVAKLFSRTGDLIQIYSDPALFRAAVRGAAGGSPRS